VKAGEDVGADEQHGVGPPALDLRAAEGERGEEAGAGGPDVDRAGAGRADRGGHERRRVGQHVVGRRRGEQEQVDVGGVRPGLLEHGLGGLRGDAGERLARPDHAALADAGARLDPAVGDAEALGDRRVGDAALGQRDRDVGQRRAGEGGAVGGGGARRGGEDLRHGHREPLRGGRLDASEGAADEAREDLARARLDEAVDAVGVQRDDGLAPAHRRGQPSRSAWRISAADATGAAVTHE
jgi:hypothetical protein